MGKGAEAGLLKPYRSMQSSARHSPGLGSSEDQRPWPALVLAALFLSLAMLAVPQVLGHFVSLDWRLGDLHPVAYGVAAVMAMLAATTWLARERVSRATRAVVPSRRQAIVAGSLVVVSSAVGLLILEGLLRAFNFPFPAEAPPVLGQRFDIELGGMALAGFDPDLGWMYLPNRSVTQEFGTARRKVPMYFDDLGLRVRRPGDRADRLAPTVLVLDASYGFGHGLTYDESFAGRLASMPDFPWQVVDLSVQGYGADQSLLLLERHFRTFNTQVVVYNWTESQSQVDDNALYDLRIRHPHSRFVGTKPLFALKPDGTPYLARAPVAYSQYRFSRLWACWQVVYQRFGPRPSVRLTRALIEAMRQYVESRGARFVVIDWDQRERGAPKPVWDLGEFPWGLKLDVIRTGDHPPADWSTWFISGDGHPDARAHRRVAELVAQEVRRVLNR